MKDEEGGLRGNSGCYHFSGQYFQPWRKTTTILTRGLGRAKSYMSGNVDPGQSDRERP